MRYICTQFEDMRFGTKVLHAGIEPDPSTGAIMTPIFQTSTYVQESPGKHKGYEYARTQNPTRTALQNNLAALENAKHGFCFGSGMAATDAIARLLKPGDEVIAIDDLYGGTYRIFTKVYAAYGIKFTFVPMENASDIEAHITTATKMIWLETPTNPTLKVIDIKRVTSIALKHQIIVVVDNTFATPYLQNPLDLGADIVIHSVTKYLAGHSDVVMGAVICNSDEIAERIEFYQNACGGVPGPQDCFLALRGIKTLHIRMQRAEENALQIAHFLKSNEKVAKVNWPGFPDHINHSTALEQMRGFGAMISFSLKDDTLENASILTSATHLFSLAESLGGVESLIGHPATMTHASIPRSERLKSGVADSLIRLSVGIEDVQDLLEDLENAFKSI